MDGRTSDSVQCLMWPPTEDLQNVQISYSRADFTPTTKAKINT